MKYVLQINRFSGPRPRVRSSRRVGSGRSGKGTTPILWFVLSSWYERYCMLLGCGVICLVGLCGYHKDCGAEIFKRYGKGKSNACRNGLVGVFSMCVGNLGNVISRYRIYGKD